MKGQSSMEFILLFVISLVVFIPILLQTNNVFYEKKSELAVGQAQSAVNALSDAVNTLCIQPQSSKLSIVLYIPTEFDPDSSALHSRTIQLSIKSQDSSKTVYANTKCSINGTLPLNGGQFKFEVKNTGANITISPVSR